MDLSKRCLHDHHNDLHHLVKEKKVNHHYHMELQKVDSANLEMHICIILNMKTRTRFAG